MNEDDLKKLVPHFVEAMVLKVQPGDVLVLKSDKDFSNNQEVSDYERACLERFVFEIARDLGATGIAVGREIDFLVLRKHNGQAEEDQETSRAEGTD